MHCPSNIELTKSVAFALTSEKPSKLKSIFVLPSNETPAIVTSKANFVEVAALPVVFWLPAIFTPGRFMSALPSKLTPPMSRAVVNVAALPVVFWLPAVFTPGRFMSALPSKLTPPMSRAVAS